MDAELNKHINLWLSALNIDTEERPELANILVQMCEYFFKLGQLDK